MADVKELRLALVCYGGSSLAIYMHGITKEIHRLVSASAARAAGAEPSGPSERVYGELLEAVSGGEGGVDLRVVVDVISGTSAGGINGIFLAKAIAENRSLDGLRDLWFTDGDIDKLVRDIHAAGLLEHVKGVGPFIDHFANAAPWKLRLGAAVLEAAHEPPFRGDMTTWLYDALAAMDEAGPASDAASLMPDGHRLDLFITMTDFYGYPRLVPVGRPAFAGESRHRHSLQFRFESGVVDEFTENNAGLALAARATSCFPGVFPPVNVPEFEQVLGQAAVTDAYSRFKRRAFRVYDLSAEQSLGETYFVDGGVLDNKPFGFTIDTVIHHRPAQSEVIRRLLYIEPDPGALVTDPVHHPAPTPPEAILGALSGIPRSEPILDDLLAVVAQNENVERLAATVESSFARVSALLDPVVPLSTLDQHPEGWPWDDWNAAIHNLAIGNTGLAYPTYTRGKLSGVVEGFAGAVCSVCAYPADSNHAVLVRATMVEWAKRRQLLDDSPQHDAGHGSTSLEPTSDQREFLQAFDVGYMRRRLRFVIAKLTDWYENDGEAGYPKRQDLDRAKAILYGRIAVLDTLAQLQLPPDAPPEAATTAANLRAMVTAAFEEHKLTAFFNEHECTDGAMYLDLDNNQLDLDSLFSDAKAFLRERLEGFAKNLLADLIPLATMCGPTQRREVAVRYLGFPIWDVLLYPIQSAAQLGEADTIHVARVSPRESGLLTGGRIEGIAFHHFYAFFDRQARENDYLWGLLHAAEQLVRLVLEASGNRADPREWSQRAFKAVLDEDATVLTTLTDTIGGIRAQLTSVTA